jgi:hypothetical protein
VASGPDSLGVDSDVFAPVVDDLSPERIAGRRSLALALTLTLAFAFASSLALALGLTDTFFLAPAFGVAVVRRHI